jgi:hypothetical protein
MGRARRRYKPLILYSDRRHRSVVYKYPRSALPTIRMVVLKTFWNVIYCIYLTRREEAEAPRRQGGSPGVSGAGRRPRRLGGREAAEASRRQGGSRGVSAAGRRPRRLGGREAAEASRRQGGDRGVSAAGRLPRRLDGREAAEASRRQEGSRGVSGPGRT